MQFGIDRIGSGEIACAHWGRFVLVCNQSSVDATLRSSVDILRCLMPKGLTALFSPQHGFDTSAQDNMIETPDRRDGFRDHLPIYSLYGKVRAPSTTMLDGVETIVFDMQLSGCRVYTYKATLLGCLKAARRGGQRVVVLDRPNPIGGHRVGGPVLSEDMLTFVGADCMPLRHGLTSGEMALFLNRTIGAELEIVSLQGWDPCSYWPQLGRTWVSPSPNLPTPASTLLYPGLVLLEACNLSEGRGTALPFECLGSHYPVDRTQLVKEVAKRVTFVQGVQLRPFVFQPTYGKWAGHPCYGLQFHLIDIERFCPIRLCAGLIREYAKASGGRFSFKAPPCEYEYARKPLDMLLGQVDSEAHVIEYCADDSFWTLGIGDCLEKVKKYLLYPRIMRCDLA